MTISSTLLALFRRTVFATAFSFFLAGKLFAADFFDLYVEPMTIEKDNVVIQGYRFLNSQGQPNMNRPWIIFTHGLSSNLHEFEYLIPQFVQAGFDCYAFNFRGHGNDEERSYVREYQSGDYQLPQMAEVDFPAMIEAIQKLHPGKGHLIGHSMGGMVPRAAFSHGTVDGSQLKSMVLIGSPAHFKTKNKLTAASDFLRVSGLVEGYINSGTGDLPLMVKSQLRNAGTVLDVVNAVNPFYWMGKFVAKRVVNHKMQVELGPDSKTEIDPEWADRSVSDRMPKDIMRSFLGFIRNGYPYENVPIPVPILHIMGETDDLAPAKDIMESAKVQSASGGHWLIQVKKMGHFGLVAPWVVRSYEEIIQKFLVSPTSVGRKNETYIEVIPQSVRSIAVRCEALL